MARFRSAKTSFTNGEVDPLLRGRIELVAYRNGADKMRNVLVLPQGGFQRRDGLEHIAELSTDNTDKFRIIPFRFSVTQNYLMVLGDGELKVYKDDELQATVTTGAVWANADLPKITWTQNLDTLIIFSENFRPQKIVRGGSHTAWTISNWTLNNIPTYDFGSGAEAVWSATRGWPKSGTFFQGRLWFAGSQSRPQTLWASRSGDPEDFDDSLTTDTYAINVTADTDDVSEFLNIKVGRHLTVFADSGEFYIPISEDTGVTPTNIVIRRTTQRGSKGGADATQLIPVVEVDGAFLFLQRGGKTLRELLFVDTEAAYQANPLSLLSSHLLSDPVDMAVRKSLSTTEADYVWLVNDDGTVAAFCTLRTQDVNAWTLLSTEGEFKQVATLLQETYFIVERNIDGGDKLFLEKFNSSMVTDAGETGTGTDLSEATGLTFLDTETVDLILDGVVQAQITVASDTATFPRTADSYEVGLPFPDVKGDGSGTWVKTLPAEESFPEGTKIGKKKRPLNIAVQCRNSKGFYVNGTQIPFRAFGSDLLDDPITAFSGIKKLHENLGWDDDGAVEIHQKEPLDMTITALAYDLAVS